jgi:hypothetical protein
MAGGQKRNHPLCQRGKNGHETQQHAHDRDHRCRPFTAQTVTFTVPGR